MGNLWLAPLLTLLAFTVGFAVRRGSVCAVNAAEQIILHKRSTRLRAFLTAACWSLIIIVPLTWLFPNHVELSQGFGITWQVVFYGAVFAAGAIINGACAFGTLAHLSGGETRYLGTILGIILGALLVSWTHADNTSVPFASVLVHPGWFGYAMLAFGALVVVFSIRRRLAKLALIGKRFKLPKLSKPRWRPATAMTVIGICSGLMNALADEWTYMSVLSHRASLLVEPGAGKIEFAAILGALSLVAGGVTAAFMAKRFLIRFTSARKYMRSIIGGMLMSIAATNIPGGNDVLLLYSIPSLAPHALAAYASMQATLLLYFVWKKKRLLAAEAPAT